MKLIKYDSLANTLAELISQRQATENATDQTLNALTDALATSGVDVDYISYTVGSEPDSSGASSGTIGAYFKEEGLFQKVEWDGSAWVEIGEPIAGRNYVEDKAIDISFPSTPTAYPQKKGVESTVTLMFDHHSNELYDSGGRDADGFPGFRQIFKDKGIRFSFSVNGRSNEAVPTTVNRMSVQKILELQDDGFEVLTHLYAHQGDTDSGLENFTYEEALASVRERKRFHESQGFKVDNAIWWGGNSTPAFRAAARKFYDSARTVTSIYSRINTRPVHQYHLWGNQLDNGNYNAWVEAVDNAIAENAWIILYLHASFDSTWDDKYDDDGNIDNVNGDYIWQKLERLIDYIQAKNEYGQDGGVNIRTIRGAINIHGNSIEAGDSLQNEDDDNFRVSKRGEVSFLRTEFLNADDSNTKLGRSSGGNAENTVNIGRESGYNNSGDYQTSVGYRAGFDNVTEYQTAVGAYAGHENDGERQTVVGSFAGYQTQGIDDMNFFGYEAGRGSSGDRCSYFGRQAGLESTGERSSFFGSFAGRENTGIRSTGIGEAAGRDNSGSQSTFVGYSAGRDNTGDMTQAVGTESGAGNTGNRSLFFGYRAGQNNTRNGYFEVKHASISDNPMLSGDLATGGIALGAPSENNKLPDSLIGANRLSFYLNEATEKLMVRVKYADGTTIKEGEVDLS